MDTVTRPGVACMWELDIIQTEQTAWRKFMMQPAPDPDAYLKTRAPDTP
jgi:hypothetical protein